MQVFISNIHGREELNAKAKAIGLKVGEICKGDWDNIPAIGGNTYHIKDSIKAAGGTWNPACSVWVFPSQAKVEEFINSIKVE